MKRVFNFVLKIIFQFLFCSYGTEVAKGYDYKFLHFQMNTRFQNLIFGERKRLDAEEEPGQSYQVKRGNFLTPRFSPFFIFTCLSLSKFFLIVIFHYQFPKIKFIGNFFHLLRAIVMAF